MNDMKDEGSELAHAITTEARDRMAGGGGTVDARGGTMDFRNDIIFSTGGFLQFPAGTRT